MAIGVALAWGAAATIALAVVLAYVSGFAMALVPVMKQAGLGLAAAAPAGFFAAWPVNHVLLKHELKAGH